jgi:hypothetical protein
VSAPVAAAAPIAAEPPAELNTGDAAA